VTQIRRLKHVADVRFSSVDKKTVDGQIDVKLCNYTDVYNNERILSDIPFMDATATPDQIVAYTLRSGDVLLTKDSETADDIGVSAYVPHDLPGVLCGYHLAVARPRPLAIDGRYLRWALVSTASRQQLELAATGVTRFGLRQDAVGGVTIPVPSLREQVAIADYLDAETTRTDALVVAKRRSVALLSERCAAAIGHAVFGAIRGGVSRSDPLPHETRPLRGGPASWRRMPIKRIARMRAGEAITSESITDAGDYPVFGGNGVRGFTTEYTHNGEYVLIGRQGALCGNVNYASGRFWASEHAVVVAPNPGVDVRWLGELLRTLNLNRLSQSAAQPGLSVEVLEGVEVEVPPADEQQAIGDYLDTLTSRTDRLVARTVAQITFILERRQALITDAVNGRLGISRVVA